MYYKKDLEMFHPKRLPHRKLQILKQPQHSAKDIAGSTWRTFWEKTTIHGVRNTSDPTMGTFERYPCLNLKSIQHFSELRSLQNSFV